jgi:hypothetical protein
MVYFVIEVSLFFKYFIPRFDWVGNNQMEGPAWGMGRVSVATEILVGEEGSLASTYTICP